MRQIRILADRLIGLSASIGATALMLVVGVILVDVIGRAFGSPLYGGQDITTMATVILVFAPMALCDRLGGHISVDLFERYFPDAMNRAIDICVALMGAVIFATLAWATWDSAKLSVMLNLSTNLLYLPKAWFQWAAIVFLCIASLGLALRALELAITGRDIRKETAS
ncbi:MAG: TRAP transporter small permease [Marivita sp.]|uniref:TRAP transporter small permease n=1 Tax=Marivita sp. TaxID=2003365 RepID=UPI0025BC3A0F|nr:TRAP transporter small permease [Marivita sp.]MCI5111941.1 TRAP transporter small permease [Marivita sp.]